MSTPAKKSAPPATKPTRYEISMGLGGEHTPDPVSNITQVDAKVETTRKLTLA